jgi:3-dehydroquinate dehydratase-2
MGYNAPEARKPQETKRLAAQNRTLVLNGPNLNMLGEREPEIYGRTTLAEIEADCRKAAGRLGLEIDFRQSNSEAELVGWIQEARASAAGVIINAAALTHTSLAILDALKLVSGPVIELHISNPLTRESFRHHSYVTPAATGLICGFGPHGYVLALEAMSHLLAKRAKT